MNSIKDDKVDVLMNHIRARFERMKQTIKVKMQDKLKNKFKKKIENIHPMNFSQKLVEYYNTTSSSTLLDLQIQDFENKALKQASLKKCSYQQFFTGWTYEDLEYFIIIGLLHQYPNTSLNFFQNGLKNFPLLIDGDIVEKSLRELSENWISYPKSKNIVLEFNIQESETYDNTNKEVMIDDEFVEISTPKPDEDISLL